VSAQTGIAPDLHTVNVPRGTLALVWHLQIDLAELEAQSRQAEEFEVPEGAVKFDLSPAQIAAALADRR
jgi:hypothetical protein